MCHCKNQVNDFGLVLATGCVGRKNENTILVTANSKIKIVNIRLSNLDPKALWEYSLWLMSNRGPQSYLAKIASGDFHHNERLNLEVGNYTLRKSESILICLSHPETTPDDFSSSSNAPLPDIKSSEPLPDFDKHISKNRKAGKYFGYKLVDYPNIDFIVSGLEL